MKFPIWLLAALGAFVVAEPARAQTEAPAAAPGDFKFDPLMNLTSPRLPPTERRQSPAAEACADASGRVGAQARVDACGKLIDSGEWKGIDIAWAYSNRCYAFLRLSQHDKALADCDKAVALDGKNAVAWQARGMILQDRSDTEGSLSSFDKAVENGANNAAVFSDRGNLLLAKGEADKALADYNKALDLAPKSVVVLIERGGAALALGKADQALADYGKALQLAPTNALAAYFRGVASYFKGDKAQAVEDFKLALKLDPKNAYPGLWLFLTRDSAEGKADLQRYSGKFSQNAWPWPVVQYDLGASDVQKTLAAAKTPGDQCEAQFYVGAERLAKGPKDEALTYLSKAAEICPKNFVEYFQAAAQLKALGKELPKPEPAMQEKSGAAGAPAAAPKVEPAQKPDNAAQPATPPSPEEKK